MQVFMKSWWERAKIFIFRSTFSARSLYSIFSPSLPQFYCFHYFLKFFCNLEPSDVDQIWIFHSLSINPKTTGVEFDSHCGVFKTVFSRLEVNPWFLWLLKLWHIFPENFIEIPQVIQKIWRFSLSILTNFINFLNFWHFLFANKLMTSPCNM